MFRKIAVGAKVLLVAVCFGQYAIAADNYA